MHLVGWIVAGIGLVFVALALLSTLFDPVARSPLVTMRWTILIGAALVAAGLWLALAGPAAAALPGESGRTAFAWRPVACAGLVAVVIWVVLHAALTWWRTPGYSLLSAFEGSLTILWGRVVVLGSALAGLALNAAGYLTDPTMVEAIKAAIPPEAVPALMIVVAWVAIWARRRTLAKE